MARWNLAFRQRRLPVGARPGAVELHESRETATIDVIRYSPEATEHHRGVTPAEARALAEPGWITWVDVVGIGDPATLQAIAELFELHPLVLDDIVEVPQRPKHSRHGDDLLFIARMLGLGAGPRLEIEQLGVVASGDRLITFQEHPGDVLDPVRERIADGKGPIRNEGTDYLCYALIDTVVDHYFPLIEELGETLEELEERIIEGASETILDELAAVRSVMLRLRRSVNPLRDSIARLVRGDAVESDVRVYFQAVADHLNQIHDVLESYRELATGLLNIHISVVAHQTNDVMRLLTVMASVFIPLTFIAGVYGMNFKFMPELDYRWAYPIAIASMVAVGGVLLWVFRRRGWLGGAPPKDRDRDRAG